MRFKRAACNCTANDEVWSTTDSLWSGSPLLLGIGGGCGGVRLNIPGGGGGIGAGGADDVRWCPEEGNCWIIGGNVEPFVVLITKIEQIALLQHKTVSY